MRRFYFFFEILTAEKIEFFEKKLSTVLCIVNEVFVYESRPIRNPS
jgi:hypothetical protein